MPYASGANRGASYVAEATYGITPTTPMTKTLRQTGVDLSLSMHALDSDEMTGDRQIHVSRTGTKSVSGTIPFQWVYSDYDDFLAAVLSSAWATNTLKVGSTLNSFTLEDRFTDINQYLVYTGCVIDQMKMSVQPGDNGAYITGEFSVLGADQSVSGTSLSTPAADTGNTSFSTCDGKIKVNGTIVKIFNSLEFTLTNNTAADYVIGNCGVEQMTQGMFELTGSLGAYFEDATYLNDFVNETNISLELDMTDVDGNAYNFAFPNVKLSSSKPGTEKQSVNLSIDFRALYDATDASTIVVTRIPV